MTCYLCKGRIVRTTPQKPQIHLFVCANQRDPTSPLGPGCGDRGQSVYLALKDEVARRRAYAAIWITKTHCLGVCPKSGATVAIYPRGDILSEVEPSDVPALLP